MADSTITRCYGNIFELHVHVVLSYIQLSVVGLLWAGYLVDIRRTFEEPAAVHLAGGNLESDNMALEESNH